MTCGMGNFAVEIEASGFDRRETPSVSESGQNMSSVKRFCSQFTMENVLPLARIARRNVTLKGLTSTPYGVEQWYGLLGNGPAMKKFAQRLCP